jgi:hypothetical protein
MTMILMVLRAGFAFSIRRRWGDIDIIFPKRKSHERRRSMKKVLLFILCFFLLLLTVESLAGSDEICCTWINTAYTSGNPPQKLVFNYDGTFASYTKSVSDDALRRGMFSITKKWRDSDGNIWYQIKMEDPQSVTRYKLAKISHDGKLLEFICKTDKYPLKMSAADADYCKYNRE